MKKIIFLVIILIVLCNTKAVGYSNRTFSLEVAEGYSYELVTKELEGATDFIIGDDTIYISFENKISKMTGDNLLIDLFEINGLNISSIEYRENIIYYRTNDKVMSYDLHKETHTVLIDNLPFGGMYTDGELFILEDKLYICVGAGTNSGVVEDASFWAENGKYDLTTKELTFSNAKYDGVTGGFRQFGSKAIPNETVQTSIIATASVVELDLEDKKSRTYAQGIRNIEGIGINSVGEMVVSVGGIENIGIRGLYGDSDYLYKLKESSEYGWPDYTGGDAVDSPKFRKEGERLIKPIFNEQPESLERPIYEHNEVAALGSLDVDIDGNLGEKDTIFIDDMSKHKIIAMDLQGNSTDILKYSGIQIEEIKISEENIFILDSKEGVFIKLNKDGNQNIIGKYKAIIGIGVVIIISLICIIIDFFIKKIK